MTFDHDFHLRAAQLSRSSPESWSNFLAEVKRAGDRAKDQILDTDLTTTPVAKGYALAFRDILTALQKCREFAEKIEAKKYKS